MFKEVPWRLPPGGPVATSLSSLRLNWFLTVEGVQIKEFDGLSWFNMTSFLFWDFGKFMYIVFLALKCSRATIQTPVSSTKTDESCLIFQISSRRMAYVSTFPLDGWFKINLHTFRLNKAACLRITGAQWLIVMIQQELNKNIRLLTSCLGPLLHSLYWARSTPEIHFDFFLKVFRRPPKTPPSWRRPEVAPLAAHLLGARLPVVGLPVELVHVRVVHGPLSLYTLVYIHCISRIKNFISTGVP